MLCRNIVLYVCVYVCCMYTFNVDRCVDDDDDDGSGSGGGDNDDDDDDDDSKDGGNDAAYSRLQHTTTYMIKLPRNDCIIYALHIICMQFRAE